MGGGGYGCLGLNFGGSGVCFLLGEWRGDRTSRVLLHSRGGWGGRGVQEAGCAAVAACRLMCGRASWICNQKSWICKQKGLANDLIERQVLQTE